jgi:hypothetical protein
MSGIILFCWERRLKDLSRLAFIAYPGDYRSSIIRFIPVAATVDAIVGVLLIVDCVVELDQQLIDKQYYKARKCED